MLKFSETKVAFYCSGVACIWVDTSCGENEIVIVAGANESLASSHVEAASNVISGARALGVSLEANREGVLTAMRIAKVYSLNKIWGILSSLAYSLEFGKEICAWNLQKMLQKSTVSIPKID